MTKDNKPTHVKKILRIDGREFENPLEAIDHFTSTLGNIFCCNKCGKMQKVFLTFLEGELNDLKQINFCSFCFTFKEIENRLGKETVEKMRKEWEGKLKRLELNSLSIAKYFYEEWKISDPVIMQRLIYFVYLEILKKENIILFEEKFQAWPGGPVLESVIYPMYKHCENLKKFFDKVKDIDNKDVNNKLVLSYLEILANKYSKIKNAQIYREARNKLWEEAREGLIEESESRPINENGLFLFFQSNKFQQQFLQ